MKYVVVLRIEVEVKASSRELAARKAFEQFEAWRPKLNRIEGKRQANARRNREAAEEDIDIDF